MLRDDDTRTFRDHTDTNPSTRGKIAATARPRLMKFMPIDEDTYGQSRKRIARGGSKQSASAISRISSRGGSDDS